MLYRYTKLGVFVLYTASFPFNHSSKHCKLRNGALRIMWCQSENARALWRRDRTLDIKCGGSKRSASGDFHTDLASKASRENVRRKPE